LEMSSS